MPKCQKPTHVAEDRGVALKAHSVSMSDWCVAPQGASASTCVEGGLHQGSTIEHGTAFFCFF